MRLRHLLFTTSLWLPALVATTLASDAAACGGLFCDSANPVNQAAERIIFAQNDDGTVTAAIEIIYEGPASEFAWVLPVPPGETEVGVSSKNALDRLEAQSNPIYQLIPTSDDDCGGDDNALTPPRAGVPDADEGEDGGVRVVAEGNAGPYVWKQIMVDPDLAEPADVAVEWLEDNGFDVTKLGPQLLGEYLEDGMNLIAFKLQKGKNSGSIRPVLLTYESERPFIPIKPTAVAANEDMGIKVWVLGNSRAVPSNYPHLELNESLINWFNPSLNYNDVVIAAANEVADGQGFVTEQSGPAGTFAQVIYRDGEAEQWNELRSGRFESLESFLLQATNRFGSFDGFSDVMSNPELVPLREGATPEQLLACIECYFQADVPVRTEVYPETPYPGLSDPIHTMDGLAFIDELYRLVIEPLEKTRALFEEHASVTRFYTTLSPDEMTLDPVFDFNPELPDVDNRHNATQFLSCEDDGWRIELPQGMVIRGQGTDWPISIEDGFPVNLRVVALGAEGEGEVVQDNARTIANLLTELKLGSATSKLVAPESGSDAGAVDMDSNDDLDKEPLPNDAIHVSDGGCGCRVKNADQKPSLGWLALLGLPLLRRRGRAPRVA